MRKEMIFQPYPFFTTLFVYDSSFYCLKIAERIAEIKNCTINEVIEQTTKNCKLLYNI